MRKCYTLYNIYESTRMLLIVGCLLSVCGGTVWADTWPQPVRNNPTNYLLSISTSDNKGNSKKIIYARAGEAKTLKLQDSAGAAIDGFICWSEEDENGQKSRNNLSWSNGLNNNSLNNNTALKLKNCLAWLRPNVTETYPSAISSIRFTVPTNAIAGDTYRVVVEGSASNKMTSNIATNLISPQISVKTVYEIHVIDKARCTNTLSDNVAIPVNDETEMEAFKNQFVMSYEVYKPMGNGTNFRLAEPLGNYYVSNGTGIESPQRVEWTAYDSNGKKLNPQPTINLKNNGEIAKLQFPQGDGKTRLTYYLIAEAVNSSGTKYAAAFRTIHLEPYIETLTQSEIENKILTDPAHYQERSEEYLLRVDTKYERIINIPFDTETPLTQNELKPENNYLTERPGILIQPSYAFANPGDFSNRKNNRRSVGRGEYAFYRTLNFANISNTAQGYNDYFMTNGDNDIRNISMVDRTKEKGGNFGHFMYLDATDEPGVITKIDVKELCPHTTLIASAWICDMAHSADATMADVGFTFKRVAADGTEAIIAKYYSGVISRSSENGVAQWKQVFFKFKVMEASAGDTYILEIANNTPDSNGADYGIDDIQIWRSLPDIRVQRKDACNASTLCISSNYETILNNLGWEQDEEVIAVNELSEPNKRKYRYGLMNKDPYADVSTLQYARKTGNVYFSFAYPKKENDPDYDTWGQKPDDWVTVNKNLLDGGEHDDAIIKGNYHKTIRVTLPTDMLDENKPADAWSKLPTTPEEAFEREVMLNVYAMNDFIADTKERPDGSKAYWNPDRDTNGAFGLDDFIAKFKTLCTGNWEGGKHEVTSVHIDKIVNNTDGLIDTYNELKKKMYVYLGIPRIRFPWRSEDGTEIFLTNVYVDNTDLRYKDEQRPGEDTPASGEYYVIIFSARTIADVHDNPDALLGNFNLADPCRLKSPFTVLPATTILIDTDLEDPTTAICQGNLKKITAILNGYDIDGNSVDLKEKGIDYIFDWYLSPRESFEADSLRRNDGSSIKTDLETYRESSRNYGLITLENISSWNDNSVPGITDIKGRLTQLIKDDLLKTGTAGAETFDLLINEKEIVAMPYLYKNSEEADYVFCTDKTPVHFDLSEEDTPDISTGIPGVTYPFIGSVPLRLGQLNLGEETELSIPVREVSGMSENTAYIGPNTRNELLLNDGSAILPIVGTAYLHIDKPTDGITDINANVTIRWNENAKPQMPEGQSYELLIPFAQYNAKNELLASACDGLASFTIKVVPEYLTWKGAASDSWYNDANWHQSTKGELYLNGAPEEDANGNDPTSNAFAPLYFTKITLPKDAILALEDIAKDEKTGILSLENNTNTTKNIQYDMAVHSTGTDGTITIAPYYGNHVSEIYFKPKAKLMNQQFLDYRKAWIEFEIGNSEKRWMTSPLQDVYAGDMYAPSANGRQETEVFQDIRYNMKDYSRWSPAFYQKAWNRAISYATDETGSSMTSVTAVQSNWSIEYNDVRVPYTPGKGFYLSVEDVKRDDETALVRLPKADAVTDYQYETAMKGSVLRADEAYSKANAGKLVALSNGSYTLNLKTAVDGDDKHFLVGNPFMTYLDMGKFFKANEGVLASKYWTLVNGAPNAVVGAQGAVVGGTVEPMQAFFVELKEGETLDVNTSITFNTDMMLAEKVEPTEVVTKSTSASHPVITLTAQRGNEKSAARLLTSDKADNGYKADEDAVVLLDSELDAPMVYTVSGSLAAQVNAVKRIQNIGLGVFHKGNDEVTVTIEGLNRMTETLYLYDTQTRKSVKLDSDSYSLQISGDSHGRYFLRDSDLGYELENTISIYSVRQGQVIVSALRPVKEIKVFSLSGSQVRRFSVNTTQYSFNLLAGIYMIYASDGEQEYAEKVIVR